VNYNQLIRNWHNKETSNEDYFSKFVFEYLAFIAYLRTQKYPSSKDDRTALQNLKQDSDLKDTYLNKLNQHEKNSWNILITEFTTNAKFGNASSLNGVEELRWWNHTCNTDNSDIKKKSGCGDLPYGYTEFDDNMKSIIFNEKDWPNMIEFWCAVRNNLFHGSKDPERPRDQLVVKHGYKTLYPLVEMLLSD
jgi:hypothetical protein